MSEPDPATATYFALFTEIGIISQLSSRLVERRLPQGFLISHFTVLNHLARMGDGRTPLSIARALQVPKTTLTHTLSGLHKAGLIAFADNPRDKRSKLVMLTDEGRGFRENAIRALAPDLELLAGSIPADRAAEAIPVLAEIRRYLDAERDDQPEGG